METKEVLNWISRNHEFVATIAIAMMVTAASIVHSVFKGIRDIVLAFKREKKKPIVKEINDKV